MFLLGIQINIFVYKVSIRWASNMLSFYFNVAVFSIQEYLNQAKISDATSTFTSFHQMAILLSNE